jgi:hypothetical protein
MTPLATAPPADDTARAGLACDHGLGAARPEADHEHERYIPGPLAVVSAFAHVVLPCGLRHDLAMPRGGEAGTPAKAARTRQRAAEDTALTWYDVLGVLPAASAGVIEQAHRDRVSVLSPARLSGAPSNVLTAAGRATAMLDQAWAILGDQVQRQRYDISAGISRPGSGLERVVPEPSEPGWAGDVLPLATVAGSDVAAEIAAGAVLAALVSFLTWRPGPSRRVLVPEVRSLFYSTCREVAARAGLRPSPVALTRHPLPVDGLVVDQSPLPGIKARRGSSLNVQVWHPQR